MARTRPFGLKVPKLPKVVLTYAESYHMPGLKIKEHCLPTLPSATEGFEVAEAYVMKAGALTRGDEAFEFQDVRIYLRESTAKVELCQNCDAYPCVCRTGNEGEL